MSIFRKTKRKKAKLRLAMIDTDNDSGDLYSTICDYDIMNINAPFDQHKYIQAI